MKSMITISVKKKHIKRGIMKSECYCPIAHAVNDQVCNKKQQARVNRAVISVVDKHGSEEILTYEMPQSAIDFVDAFDRLGMHSAHVNPFVFSADEMKTR